MAEPEPEPAPKARHIKADDEEPPGPDPQAAATGLLTRALRIGTEKEDDDWLHNSAVKAQMKRMDPSFSEKSLGFKSFSDFLRSRTDIVELDESSTTRLVRLRGGFFESLSRRAAVAGHQLVGRRRRHVPTVAAQPIGDVVAFFEIPQLVGLGHLELRVRLGHEFPNPVHPLTPLRAALGVGEVGT